MLISPYFSDFFEFTESTDDIIENAVSPEGDGREKFG